ncbi:AMIN domain-containing protein [Gemmatimonas groenlandica]|uniref:AMIN domain-containing protein n=1 Tax=Gemmatimonas groenlandica TaxID=2732249 RepID=A0A6M4IJW3_9BACT|nr:AMIN domain-containing protein [Gemmatimonas groenlandica]
MMGPTTVAVISALLAPGALALAHVNAPADGYAGYTAPSAHVAITSRTDVPTRGRVSSIAVAPASAGADIVLAIDSSVTLKHFTLDNPSRIVVDLGGANLAIRSNYDGKARGPVRNLRLSQYRADTVRLVIDLDGSRSYTVVREGGSVRIALSAPAVAFARWGSSSTGGELSSQVAAGRLEQSAPTAPVVAQVEAKPQAKPVEAKPVEVQQVETPIVKAGPQSVVLDDHSGDPLTARTPATVSSMAAARRQQQKPRITVSYDGTNIRDVIAAFATFSGRTIVVGKDVTGDVTADIADKPWDVALQAILQAQGLAATEDASGIITVDSYRNLATNQALEPLVTQIIDINYSKASVLRGTVQQLLARDCTGLTTMATGRDMGMPMNQGGGGSGGQQDQTAGQGCVVRGSVAADSATNKLIITEVPSRLPEIVARVQQLDVRTPQVAIKAKIIFVNRTGIQDIGLAYDLGKGDKQFFQQLVPRIDPNTLTAVDTDGDGVPDSRGGGTAYEGPARIALGGNALAGIANANNAIKPNALNLIYSTALGRYQLTAFLNALQTSSLADVQSEPSITILNNRSAEIFVGQEIPIRVIDASSGGGGQGGGGGGGGGGGTGSAERGSLLPPRDGLEGRGRYQALRDAADHQQSYGAAQHQGRELECGDRGHGRGRDLQPPACGVAGTRGGR